MNKYELLLILSDTATEEVRETLMTKIEELLTANGATVEATDKWGMRKLAYPINYRNEGYYVLYKLAAPSDCPAKVENALNIMENVVRSMFVKK